MKIEEWFENHHQNVSREEIRKKIIENIIPNAIQIFENALT